MATNSPWGTANTTADAPWNLVNGMKAAGYANTLGTNVVGLTAAGVTGANSGLHTGWVYKKAGTGPVANVVITAGGTAYSNTYYWRLQTGTTEANGTIVTNGSGVITSLTITNVGAGFAFATSTLQIANSAGGTTLATGSGATLTANIGGRGGRTTNEVLIAQSSMSAS
jgi:hypothetical protein